MPGLENAAREIMRVVLDYRCPEDRSMSKRVRNLELSFCLSLEEVKAGIRELGY